MTAKPRILTGDTPTGKLHLGHYVGSLENRVQLQDDYDCYFIIANIQGFTTRAERFSEVRASVLEVALDYLAAGIDPAKSTIFIQSEIPAIAELTIFFSMITSYSRVLRNPTLKDEIRDKNLGDNYPFGFAMYPVSQAADILAFRADLVPVGEDQLPHLELTREIARRFNQIYCGVDPQTEDNHYVTAGGLFPIIQAKLGRVHRLVGLGGPNVQGQLLKMSKSLNNAIYLSDSPDEIKTKVMGMYTDPNRLKATDPGTIENNPLWIFHDTFNTDKAWVEQAKEQYRLGQIGDVVCKKQLIDVLVNLIEPMRQKRLALQNNLDFVQQVLRDGTRKANETAEQTLAQAKAAMQQNYFARTLTIE